MFTCALRMAKKRKIKGETCPGVGYGNNKCDINTWVWNKGKPARLPMWVHKGTNGGGSQAKELPITQQVNKHGWL